jgi:hypothetical protein
MVVKDKERRETREARHIGSSEVTKELLTVECGENVEPALTIEAMLSRITDFSDLHAYYVRASLILVSFVHKMRVSLSNGAGNKTES